jgi:hypothetical protein
MIRMGTKGKGAPSNIRTPLYPLWVALYSFGPGAWSVVRQRPKYVIKSALIIAALILIPFIILAVFAVPLGCKAFTSENTCEKHG